MNMARRRIISPEPNEEQELESGSEVDSEGEIRADADDGSAKVQVDLTSHIDETWKEGEGTKENSDGSDLEEDEDAHIPEEQAGPGASTQVLAEQDQASAADADTHDEDLAEAAKLTVLFDREVQPLTHPIASSDTVRKQSGRKTSAKAQKEGKLKRPSRGGEDEPPASKSSTNHDIYSPASTTTSLKRARTPDDEDNSGSPSKIPRVEVRITRARERQLAQSGSNKTANVPVVQKRGRPKKVQSSGSEQQKQPTLGESSGAVKELRSRTSMSGSVVMEERSTQPDESSPGASRIAIGKLPKKPRKPVPEMLRVNATRAKGKSRKSVTIAEPDESANTPSDQARSTSTRHANDLEEAGRRTRSSQRLSNGGATTDATVPKRSRHYKADIGSAHGSPGQAGRHGHNQANGRTEGPNEPEEDEDVDRVFDQKHRLAKIFTKADEILGERARTKTKEGQEIATKCEKAVEILTQAADAENEDALVHPDDLHNVLKDVFYDLNTLTKGDPPFGAKKLITHDMYLNIIPEVVTLLEATLLTYDLAAARTDDDEISYDHACTLEAIIHAILQAHAKVLSWKVQSIVAGSIQRVKHDIIAPLKDVKNAIHRAITDMEQEKAAQEARLAQRQEEKRRKQSQLEKRKREFEQHRRDDIWRELRIMRMFVETDPGMVEKLRAGQEDDEELNVDANDQEFERVDAFGARNGSLRCASRCKIQLDDWPDEDLDELVNALRGFPGPDPVVKYTRIFKKYCGLDGPLKEYTADEIVDMAACLKEQLMFMDKLEGRETEEWVLNIPKLQR